MNHHVPPWHSGVFYHLLEQTLDDDARHVRGPQQRQVLRQHGHQLPPRRQLLLQGLLRGNRRSGGGLGCGRRSGAETEQTKASGAYRA